MPGNSPVPTWVVEPVPGRPKITRVGGRRRSSQAPHTVPPAAASFTWEGDTCPVGSRATGASKVCPPSAEVAYQSPTRPGTPVYQAAWTAPRASTAMSGPMSGQPRSTQPSSWTRAGGVKLTAPSAERAAWKSRTSPGKTWRQRACTAPSGATARAVRQQMQELVSSTAAAATPAPSSVVRATTRSTRCSGTGILSETLPRARAATLSV